MAQDDLKVKIKKIWLWTILGIIFFLIISFFLKSSYPLTHYKFNLHDAYEVLKDSLSLAAAFLAPIAAFVLFSDWRVSHRLINNEKEVIEIQKKLHNTCYGVQDLVEMIVDSYERGLTRELLNNFEAKAFKFLSEILGLIGRIEFSGKNFKDTSFHFKSNGLLNEQYIILSNSLRMFEAFRDLENFKINSNEHDQLQKLIYMESKFSSIFFELSELYLENFDHKLEEIDELANAHRIY
ncbi:hypothetical protein NRF55_003114 [Acinetobacter baumannii]|nr:hypothetical protein [Acinetobacter baumannii]ELS4601988.1 hypothetical protein [Acinetobacter baumannii]